MRLSTQKIVVIIGTILVLSIPLLDAKEVDDKRSLAEVFNEKLIKIREVQNTEEYVSALEQAFYFCQNSYRSLSPRVPVNERKKITRNTANYPKFSEDYRRKSRSQF